MDKVTQQNAANAEESASAAEEMSAQAETMLGMVGELVAMVGGAGNAEGKTAKQHGKPHAMAAAIKKMKGKVSASKRTSKKAEEVIPLNDKEFAEF